MPRFTQLARGILGAILFSFTAKIVFSQKVLAYPKSELTVPTCYMTLADGRTIDLNQLCAKVDEAKRIESTQDKTAAIKDFYNHLPFSPETRKLLMQGEALQQRLAQTEDKAEMQQIFGQIQDLKQQMMHDPNYIRYFSLKTGND